MMETEEMLERLQAEKKKYITMIQHLKAENKCMQLKYNQLSRENEQLIKRSDDLTRKMADTLATTGYLENLGDEFSNTKLVNIFQKVYDYKWTALLEWIYNNMQMREREAISHVTKLMKKCYKTCLVCANEQMRVVFSSRYLCVLPTESEEPTLYKIRRKYGQTEKKRTYMKEQVRLILERYARTNPSFINTCNRANSNLGDFLKEFIECCWLMTISNPPLVLKFDIVGKQHTGKLVTLYSKYSTEDTIVDRKKIGTIVEVVWPAVTTKDEASVYKKGDVMTVDEHVYDNIR